jgi:hypothetical protein
MRYGGLQLALWAGVILFGAHEAQGQSVFDGTWKVDTNQTKLARNSEILMLKNGKYRCDGCTPSISVRADGIDHRVKGSPYFDAINVRMIDRSTLEEEAKAHGEVVMFCRLIASTEGRTATLKVTEPGTRNEGSGAGEIVLTRAGKARHSDSPDSLTGSWAITGQMNPVEATFTLSLNSDTKVLTMTTVSGKVYHAPLTGPENPLPAMKEISASLMGTYTFTETLSRSGVPIREHRLMVDPHNPTVMTIIDTDRLSGITLVMHAVKQ